MSLDSNKDLIRRLFSDVLNRANPSALDTLVAADYTEQEPFPNQPAGRAGVAARLAMLFGVFPDARYELQELVAEGDRVVARWTMYGTQQLAFLGVPASHRQITLNGIDIYTIKLDQISSHIDQVNLYGFLAQVNALP